MNETKWLGRQPKGFRCSHSFKAFVEQAKKSKEGREKLKRNHGGYGL